jgi:tetratricopeptide (TPR) repeat protein
MTLWRISALATLTFASVAAEAARPPAWTAETLYVRARAAEVLGRPDLAAANYASALAAARGDLGLALRAFRQALAAGDFPSALRASAVLQAKGALPDEGQFFVLATAVRGSDWTAAGRALEALDAKGTFSFLTPTIRAWLAFGARAPEPLRNLDTSQNGLAGAYGSEHRALIQLARGELDAGVAGIRALASGSDPRQVRLRLIAAAALQRARRTDEALALLAGTDSASRAARALVTAGKPIPAPVASASDGLGELFARLALDINRERATPLSLTLARIATYLVPQNSETWLVTSELLSASRYQDAALAALARIAAGDPFTAFARASRIQIWSRAGKLSAALDEALKITAMPDAQAGDWVRVAEIYGQLDRHAEAAEAYGRALALSEQSGDGSGRWGLWLLRGGARERAGQWPAAKADLLKAAALAPEEPSVLNYLGYAQIERRENLVEARALVEKASRLRPDDAAITDSLGWAYFLDGEIQKAIELLERAAAGEPGESTINEHLGDAYWTARRRREARFAWRAALVHAEAEDAIRIRTKIEAGLSPAVAAP